MNRDKGKRVHDLCVRTGGGAVAALAQGVFCCDIYTVVVTVVLFATIIGPALLKPRLARF